MKPTRWRRVAPVTPLRALLLALVAGAPAVAAEDWLWHRSRSGLTFEYPSRMSLADDGRRVTLRHALPLRHVDPCVLRDGDDAWRDDLLDFEVTLEVLDQALPAALAREGGLVPGYVSEGQVRVSPGFVDPWRFGPLSGFRLWMSVEGCGRMVYHLRLSPARTLRVAQRSVPELSPIVPDGSRFREAPGVILPEEAQRLLDRIVGSARGTETGKN